MKKLGLLATLGMLVMSTACSKPQEEEKVVNLYTWADYFTPEVIDAFTKKTGIRVQVDTYDSNEALMGKLRAGASGYDVILPSDYTVTILGKQGKLMKLDKAKLPNLVNLEEQFTNPSYDPGLVYSVPFMWGTTGIGYLNDKITEPVDSWNALINPNPAYVGRISLLKDPREVFGVAFKLQGKSINTTDEASLKQALDMMIAQKAAAKTLYNSENYRDLLGKGELWMTHGWSSMIALVRYTLKQENVRYIIPKEGGVIYMDTFAIPSTAPHKEAAYTFINYFLDGEASAMVSNLTCGSNPNKAARPFIRPELLNDPMLYPPPEVLSKLEFISDVGDATRNIDMAWTQLAAE